MPKCRITSCARGDTICLRRSCKLIISSYFIHFIRQVAPFQHVGYLRHKQHKLTFDLVSESHVTWASYVPILAVLGFSVLELAPMYATDRRQTSDKSIAN